jgi:DNA-binding NarL/FixJ family response regulator
LPHGPCGRDTNLKETTVTASKPWTCSSPTPGLAPGKRAARRVLIIDNHPIVREGLRRIIDAEQDLVVCGEADTARAARLAINDCTPDVLVADIGLNEGDGIELVREVRAHHSQLPILVLSGHDETIYAERLLSVGANGYIMKQASSGQILVSLRRVLDGDVYVSEHVGFNMHRKSTARGTRSTANPIDRLSNRELQILHLIGKGMSTRETAKSLHLSIKTVESHRQRLKTKLCLNTGTQLVQYAINWFAGQDAARRDYLPGAAPAAALRPGT